MAEKRRALDKWAMRLAEIVGEAMEPAGAANDVIRVRVSSGPKFILA